MKQLSLRIDDNIHNQIAQAAQKANKSINAWMVEILSEAAEDALGSNHKLETSYSEEIQWLTEDEQIMAELTAQTEIGLQTWNLRSALRFYVALNRLLAGLDAVNFLLQSGASGQATDNGISLTEDDKNKLRHLTECLFYFLPEDDDPSSLLRLNIALKKLVQGLIAVKPFFEKETVESTCNLTVKIAGYLSDFQRSPGFTE